METDKYILITGANGEVGHGLITKLTSSDNKRKIIAFDLNDLDKNLIKSVSVFIKGSVTDKDLIDKIFSDYKIDVVFHLAAVLSTGGEKNPELAHNVNIEGTFNLLNAANSCAIKGRRSIKFIFPSTIAVYGMPDLQSKRKHKKVKEGEFLNPITMYGINKLYCENLGRYFSSHYQSLTMNKESLYLDFRCVRFPGLISAETTPSGGTSDYAPEMLHNAAAGKDYQCFVRPDSTIHFMAMPDAIEALLKLTNAPKNKLTTHIYNIEGFTASAHDIEKIVKKHFPKAGISYKINSPRQNIVDSWSEDVDGSKAVKDWGWKAKYNFKKAFEEYLIPSIIKKYN
jgi:nucleoside-diphosphate-sugar epimerase